MASLLKQGTKAELLIVIQEYSGARLRTIQAGEVFTAVEPKTREKVYLILSPTGLGGYKLLKSATCAC